MLKQEIQTIYERTNNQQEQLTIIEHQKRTLRYDLEMIRDRFNCQQELVKSLGATIKQQNNDITNLRKHVDKLQSQLLDQTAMLRRRLIKNGGVVYAQEGRK